MRQSETVPEGPATVDPPAAAAPGVGTGLRIAYLTGSFPSATHTFFWREIQAMRRLGAHVDVVSTRAPAEGASGEGWRARAAAETTYLVENARRGPGSLLVGALAAGPRGWWSLLRSIRATPAGERGRGLWLSVPLGIALARLARVRGWQHVHVGFTENAANVALFANRLSGLSYSVAQGHMLSRSGGNQREKWRHASFGAAISRFLLNEVREALRDAAPPRLVLAPRGIAPDVFRRTSEYVVRGDDETLRVFTCGRITAAKAYVELVDALSEVRAAGVPIELRAVGVASTQSESYRREVLDRIRGHDLDGAVTWLGTVSQETIRAELERAHVAVFPAAPWSEEGWGNSIAESVAMGTPTVACRSGGVVDTVEDEVSGLLAEPGDSESLARCMLRIARSQELARTLGSQGAALVRERFHPDAGATVLLSEIRSVLGPEEGRA